MQHNYSLELSFIVLVDALDWIVIRFSTSDNSPKIHEDEDCKEKRDDGDRVSEQEDEDLPVKGVDDVVETVFIVGEVVPASIIQTHLGDVVCKQRLKLFNLKNIER